jgi:hypothetical protein
VSALPSAHEIAHALGEDALTIQGEREVRIAHRRAGLAAELRAAALTYAAASVPVFPCGSNKRPLIGRDKDGNGRPIPRSGGLYKATTDESRIRAWWRAWPLAMIGMPTGSRSGQVVLDVDVKSGVNGFDTLRRNGWIIPSDAVEVKTPSGGSHFYFSVVTGEKIGNSAGKLGPGLDIRGEGGYVILPPSRPSLDGPDYSFAEWMEVRVYGRFA